MRLVREEELEHGVEEDDGYGIIDDALAEEQAEKRRLLLILDH